MNRLSARFHVAYPEFQLRVEVSFPTQGVTTLFGPSGCGKTTLLRCLAGLERSPTGFLQFDGEVWQDETKGIFIPIHKRGIGVVFQESRLFPHLTVQQNLVYGQKRIRTRPKHILVDQVIDLLGLTSLLGNRPHQLSGGEQQRVAIGRALLASPRLLLMDEPLASLDLPRKREILPFIQRVHHNLRVPIIYVSHAIQEILQLTHTLVFLKEGHLVAAGPIQEVLGRMDLPGVTDPQLMGSVLDTTIAGHEPEFGLTRVEFLGKNLFVPHQDFPIGVALRLHILSKDVSLATGTLTSMTSVLNVLEGTIVEIGESRGDRHAVEVKVDVGCPLLATITRKSLQHLDLKMGQRVFAHVKAVALSHDLPE